VEIRGPVESAVLGATDKGHHSDKVTSYPVANERPEVGFDADQVSHPTYR
jgi:hypothetical protein